MEEKICSKSGFFLFILLCFTYFSRVESKPPDPQTLLDFITVCPTVNFVNNSTYFTKCAQKLKPKSVSEDDDINMCMVTYDIMSRICSYNSQIPIGSESLTLKLPKTAKDFDDELLKLKPKSNTQLGPLCANISSLFKNLEKSAIKNREVEPFIKKVKEVLVTDECIFKCHVQKDSATPFCMIFSWANEIFNLMNLKEISNRNEKHDKTDKIDVVSNNDPMADKKEPITIEKNKASEQSKIQKTDMKKEEQVTIANKDSVNPLPKSNLPSSGSNKSNDLKVKSPDIPNNNEAQSNVDIKKTKDEGEGKDDDGLPISSNMGLSNAALKLKEGEGKDNSLPISSNMGKSNAVPKPQENLESPSVVQSEDVNVDNEQNLVEDHSNNKGNENEGDEGNEHDADDVKESGGILDETEISMGNTGDQPLLDIKKPFYQTVKDEEESHFFTYFSVVSLMCIALYVGYHNKQKILAILLEGRRSRRGRSNRRRPSTANYRKLDSNLEEAVTSQCNSNVTHVIY